jgi:CHAT domain-containing protein
MAVVDEYRGSLGATELRIHAASYGTDLARLGIRLALEERRAKAVLRWAERWRAGALQRPPVRPPDDEKLAVALTQLRQAHADLRTAALQGTPRSGGEGTPATALRRSLLQSRITQLERAVRTQTLKARDDQATTGQVDIAAIQAALGGRTLVEYVAWGGRMYAVTVAGEGTRLHDLGPIAVEEETRYLVFAIRRLWSRPARPAAEKALDATASRLDDLLLRPLRLPPQAPVVIVPTGQLHGLPWSALPSLAERPTTIAPSAALWLGKCEGGPAWGPALYAAEPTSLPAPAPRGPSIVLVAGPQLAGADDEVHQIAALYPNCLVLSGAEASAAAVMAALGDTDVVHLAAHGRFRADSPLFSSVLLADGPLTVYDLERIQGAPATVILAACDAAVSDVRAGDELLGTAAALIGLGVRRVVAPVMPVPDGATTDFMVALHRRLLTGDRLSAALATARAGQDRAVAAAFICVGCEDT